MTLPQFTALRQQGYFSEVDAYTFHSLTQSDYVGNKWGSAFPDTYREHSNFVKWNKKLNRQYSAAKVA